MVKLFIIFFILSLNGCAKSQSGYLQAKLHIARALIIEAGESNATFLGHNDSLPTGGIGIHPLTQLADTTTFQFSTLNLMPGGRSGFEAGIAMSGDSGTLGTVVFYVVNVGVSGSIIRYWNDSTIIFNGANPWEKFKTRVDTAIKLITAIDGYPPAIYLLWTQGINDAVNLVNPVSWKDSTETFFTKYRLRYGDNTPIFITNIPVEWSTYNDQITVMATEVQKLNQLVTSDAQLAFGDNKHWSTSGLKTISTRFVYTLKSRYRFY